MPTPGLQERPLNSPAETATFFLCVVFGAVFEFAVVQKLCQTGFPLGFGNATKRGNIGEESMCSNVITGTFKDTRDGKDYKTVTICGQIWMAENLDYAGNGGVYYDNAASPPFVGAGRLYTWDQAMQAVPKGWHLSSYDEWDKLMYFVGGYSTAGTELKAAGHWNKSNEAPIGMDTYGFSALPGGWGDSTGKFKDIGDYGYWWDIRFSFKIVHRWFMRHDREDANWNNSTQNNLYSVRCIQDY